MFVRLLIESFRRQRRRKLLAGVAILLGTTAVTAMLALATTIGDRIHKELAVYGANIVVYPKAELLDVKVGGVDVKPATGGATLHESDLEKLKGIFWANNITGMSPELAVELHTTAGGRTVTVPALGLWFGHAFTATMRTGAPAMHPWWRLSGAWPAADDDVVLGSGLAKSLGLHVGDTVSATEEAAATERTGPAAQSAERVAPRIVVFKVTGIVSAGDATDAKLLLPLGTAQRLANMPDAVSRVDVGARTLPEDAFAKSDPDKLPAKLRDVWYCRPYANSIAFQIREAIPAAQAEQVRQVEQSEGTVLERISGLMWLISGAALLAAGFAVSAAMATAILERRAEIGLMRSLGASRSAIALLFYAETGLLAVFAGVAGYLVGSGLAAVLGARIFPGDGALTWTQVLIPALLPVVVGLAVAVALLGSTPAIRAALRLDPSAILRGES